MSTLVTNEDGSEAELADHLMSAHKKGAQGLTDEYLATLHKTLHQRTRDVQAEHDHPGDDEPDDRQLVAV